MFFPHIIEPIAAVLGGAFAGLMLLGALGVLPLLLAMWG